MVASEIQETSDEEQLIRDREWAAVIAAQNRRRYMTQQQYYVPWRNPSLFDAFNIRR